MFTSGQPMKRRSSIALPWVSTPVVMPSIPAGTVLALGTERGDVFLHDLQTGELLQSIDAHEEIVTALAYTPDGNQLISASSREQRLRYWFNIR
jgi:WD40 repeat protein